MPSPHTRESPSTASFFGAAGNGRRVHCRVRLSPDATEVETRVDLEHDAPQLRRRELNLDRPRTRRAEDGEDLRHGLTIDHRRYSTRGEPAVHALISNSWQS